MTKEPVTTTPASRPSTPGQRAVLYALMACAIAFICLMCTLLLAQPQEQAITPLAIPSRTHLAGGPMGRGHAEEDSAPLDDQQLATASEPLVRAVDGRDLSQLLGLTAQAGATPPEGPGSPWSRPSELDIQQMPRRLHACAALDHLLARAQQPWEGTGLRLQLFLIHGLLLTQAPPEVVASRIDAILTHASGPTRQQALQMMAMFGYADQRPDALDHLASRVDASIDATTRDLVQLLVEASRVAIHSPFPAFALTDLDGHVHRLGEYRGHLLVIHLWTSSSPPCVRLAGQLAELQRRLPPGQVAFLGIDGDPHPRPGQGVAASMPWPQVSARQQWPVAPIGPWGVHQLPTWLLIDAQGVLRARGGDIASLAAALRHASSP